MYIQLTNGAIYEAIRISLNPDMGILPVEIELTTGNTIDVDIYDIDFISDDPINA